jgi:putative copper export protein/methionine-rich copper-binding protein CopC
MTDADDLTYGEEAMSRRTMLRLLGSGLLAIGAVAGWAGPAFAHAELLSTEPEYGATLTPGLDRVVVHYDLAVDVRGAQVTLERSGKPLRAGRPAYASADHKDVALPLPALGRGSYLLTWFLFGADGDVMGGQLPFTVDSGTPINGSHGRVPTAATSPPAAGARPAPERVRAFAPLSRAQDVSRLLGFASIVVVVGGVTFVAGLWRAGAALSRTRALLGGSLAVAVLATTAGLGLKGAAVSGQSALGAFSPAALTALDGTHVGRVLVARLGFLALAVPVVAYLTMAPHRALRSHRWWIAASVSGVGALTTHGLLSHASTRGPLAVAADVVHLGAVFVWLGGLTVLVVMVIPRRRRAELSLLVPRFSRLAFGSVSTAAVAGTVLLLLISPRWTALPGSAYGRFLLLKLGLVAVLLAVAAQTRDFVRRRLPDLTRGTGDGDTVIVEAPVEERVLVAVGAGSAASAIGPLATVWLRPTESVDLDVRLRPFVTAVTAELCIAASVLAVTAALVGRSPPT